MQKITKAINSDSLRPSIKPILTHKSDNFDYMRPTLTANNSEKRNYGKFDSIKERQTTGVNNSNFIENNIYSSNKDLASSFSFSEQDQKYQYEKMLFSKFLLSNNHQCLNFISDMNKINKQDLLSFVKIGEDQKSIHKNKIISHFIAVWLQSMGYNEFETKKKIVMNLQFIFTDEPEASQIGAKLYETLFHGYLPQNIQLRLLIEVCKKGWQYLSFFIGKYIKILKKFNLLSEQSFILEVQKCI